MMVATLEKLAQRVSGEIVGNSALEIRGVAALTKAGPHEISFAGDEQNLRKLGTAQAGACLVARKDAGSAALQGVRPALVLVDDPLDAFVATVQYLRPQPERLALGISPAAHIDPSAEIGESTNVYPGVFVDAGAVIGRRCELYPGVYVGRNCRIGDDCVLQPHVVLYSDVSLGNRILIHAAAVLGADGFGYRFRQGRFEKIPQLGWVEIHDDCEIGAGTTIDRGMVGPTVIGAGTKLDDQVMIGHNCELGKHNAFASQVGLAGSVTSGDYVRLGGQVGVADHVHLGEKCTLGAKAGVHKDIPAGETHIGYPARPEQEQLRIVMATGKVPEMRKQIRELEKQLAAVLKQLEQLTSPPVAQG
ncbi:MAG TPA: UDP-3-O-(3-hydroxymyristoyl)glucosamine N-acyltransferase [Planctomycetaceae bacterium]|nr:UDP-3-O-(3-hydroxymyristoyl)glucosamine N-acyltransferase [Planctomycetaceae bacterium]